MQRLFTVFPGGWPGTGLLLLRLAAAIPLLIGGSSALWGVSHGGLFVRFVAIAVGGLLLVGLWTPFAGTLQVAIELWVVFSSRDQVIVHLLLSALGASLAMLGPGAWSLDARLYGRKRIEIR